MTASISSGGSKHPGLSGSGKSTLASGIVSRLYRKDVRAVLLDGDVIRQGLSKDLGFTKADRFENLRRITSVIRLMKGAGRVVVAAFIVPSAVASVFMYRARTGNPSRSSGAVSATTLPMPISMRRW